MTRWRTTLAIDADAKAVEVYRANMPGVEVRWEPVDASKLPRADVLLGGPAHGRAARQQGEQRWFLSLNGVGSGWRATSYAAAGVASTCVRRWAST